MKISIITTIYNREKTIGDAIESVLAQNYDDIEYIIVDGASKDGSLEVVKKYASAIESEEFKLKHPHFIFKYISENDNGMYEAINKGIKMASGDVIALCHSDDFIYSNDTVGHVVKKMVDTSCDFLYADGVFVSQDNIMKPVRRWISGNYSCCKVKNGWLPLHPTCYIKRSLINRLGYYDDSYKIAADTDLLVRYLSRNDVKVAYLHEFVTKMRMGGMSTDSKKRRLMWNEDVNVYRNHGFKFPILTKIEKMIWKVPQFISAKLFKP